MKNTPAEEEKPNNEDNQVGCADLFFVDLDDAQRERLAILSEECGEVIQAIGKILRHGYSSHHPEGGPDNRSHLERELGDLQGIIDLMAKEDDVNRDRIRGYSLSKLTKLLKWTHFQKNVIAQPPLTGSELRRRDQWLQLS